MRRYHEILIHHKFTARSTHVGEVYYKKCGNHMLTSPEFSCKRNYWYHDTCIVSVNPALKIIVINNGGWDTNSTRTAISGYVSHYYKPGWLIEYARTHVGRKDW